MSAHLVWAVCVTVALWLGVSALLVGLRVDEESVVGAVVRWVTWVDLPYVGRGADVLPDLALDPVHRTVGAWGGAALVWLVLGLAMTLALRPRSVVPTPGA